MPAFAVQLFRSQSGAAFHPKCSWTSHVLSWAGLRFARAQGAPLISGRELPRLTVYPEVVTDIHRWADGSKGKHSPAAAVLRLADSHGLVRGSTWCPGLVGDNTPLSPALVPEPPADSFAGIDTPSDLARQASAGLAPSSCFLPSFMDCASSSTSAVHQPREDGMFVSLPDIEVQLLQCGRCTWHASQQLRCTSNSCLDRVRISLKSNNIAIAIDDDSPNDMPLPMFDAFCKISDMYNIALASLFRSSVLCLSKLNHLAKNCICQAEMMQCQPVASGSLTKEIGSFESQSFMQCC